MPLLTFELLGQYSPHLISLVLFFFVSLLANSTRKNTRGRIRLLRLRSGLRRFASLLLHLPRIILTQSSNCLPAYRVEVFDIDAISGDIALKIGSPSDTRQDPPPGANGGGGVQLPPSAVSAVPLF